METVLNSNAIREGSIDNTKLSSSGSLNKLEAILESGTEGQVLTKTATGQEWNDVDGLPSQEGMSGKFLSTDGTNAYWGDIPEKVNDEHVYVHITSSDGELSADDMEVLVAIDGGATLTYQADENGDVDFLVPINSTYVVSVPGRGGYQPVASYTLKAVSSTRHLYFTYQKVVITDTCTVKIKIELFGARPEQQSMVAGKTINLKLSNDTSRSEETDANGVATFLNVTKGLAGYTYNPKIAGFVTPAAGHFNTDYNVVEVTLTYNYISAVGVFMVRTDGEEFTYDKWDTSDNLVAIHVATQALAESGNDYYIPVNELIDTWFVSTHYKQWTTEYGDFPNVPVWNQSSPYYNGAEATQNMISDAAALEINSPAAEFAIETYFTLKGITAQGYIGTRDQWQVMVDNEPQIANMLELADLVSVWKSRDVWSSSQISYAYAWHCSSGVWSNGIRTYSFYVIPFFAI